MKIAILGSRGIPNNYGGFEQFAEYLSKSLVSRGHEVCVYNPHYHSFKASQIDGVQIRHIFNPETFMGTAGNFIYDFLSLQSAVKSKPDIILMLGYTTSSVWFRFFNFTNSELVTNLDGLEWKRDKWSPLVKRMTRWFEKLAVRYGGYLVADHTVIQDYFLQHYKAPTIYIPYGAYVFNDPDEEALREFQLEKQTYCLMIARFEAEHNIDMIIEGYLSSNRVEKLVLVGNYTTSYGARLYSKYKNSERVRFLGGIYDLAKLNHLRYFSRFYFHGHSIGGTNPSLLEAMASSVLILAHQNPFNQNILGEDAHYFSSAQEISDILNKFDPVDPANKTRLANNVNKIISHYNWEQITTQYENLFSKIISDRSGKR